MKPLVPVLIVAAGLATLCAAAALITGLDATFDVAVLLSVLCLAATAGINFRAERERERAALVDDSYLQAGVHR
ncbi:hypothetical protein [Mycobacterium asiaticum]|uniref:UsfY protein n=1 Tax=Mycobacterium asiaticum TaxID=1790 RepID=A0A1A3NL18_MYCAS|nr:hypothetical protein [Mycobacterium asiaticum]OBK22521.1 hypothetical protein A5635_21635 [Mycobacterium asiaticum]